MLRYRLIDLPQINTPAEEFAPAVVKALADAIDTAGGLARPLLVNQTGPEAYALAPGQSALPLAACRELAARGGLDISKPWREMAACLVVPANANAAVRDQIG